MDLPSNDKFRQQFPQYRNNWLKVEAINYRMTDEDVWFLPHMWEDQSSLIEMCPARTVTVDSLLSSGPEINYSVLEIDQDVAISSVYLEGLIPLFLKFTKIVMVSTESAKVAVVKVKELLDSQWIPHLKELPQSSMITPKFYSNHPSVSRTQILELHRKRSESSCEWAALVAEVNKSSQDPKIIRKKRKAPPEDREDVPLADENCDGDADNDSETASDSSSSNSSDALDVSNFASPHVDPDDNAFKSTCSTLYAGSSPDAPTAGLFPLKASLSISKTGHSPPMVSKTGHSPPMPPDDAPCPAKPPKTALILGMVFSEEYENFEPNTSRTDTTTGQWFRDGIRLEEMANMGYNIHTLDHKHKQRGEIAPLSPSLSILTTLSTLPLSLSPLLSLFSTLSPSLSHTSPPVSSPLSHLLSSPLSPHLSSV